MIKRRRTLLAAALFMLLAPLAFADSGGINAPPAPDPERPAIGEWIGLVSWNEPVVHYAWSIYPDGGFSSGRAGRGQSGGGTWSANGAHITLKYEDGFRYEGELSHNAYSGTAYLADGTVFGDFSMWRDMKSRPDVEEFQ